MEYIHHWAKNSNEGSGGQNSASVEKAYGAESNSPTCTVTSSVAPLTAAHGVCWDSCEGLARPPSSLSKPSRGLRALGAGPQRHINRHIDKSCRDPGTETPSPAEGELSAVCCPEQALLPALGGVSYLQVIFRRHSPHFLGTRSHGPTAR